MKKYPHTEQFRAVIRKIKERHDFKGYDEQGKAIYKHDTPYPTLDFEGTVKVHGTNASVVKYKDRIEFQSRNNVLGEGEDNAGFKARFKDYDFSHFFDRYDFNDYVGIYGEWAGGNIQKGVAVNGLEKMFIIFAVCVDGVWEDVNINMCDVYNNIYNAKQFKTFNVKIDFNTPELSIPYIIESTLAVEEKCPVGLAFGVEGIGEGIVFKCVGQPDVFFKSKGEKHSVSKVKKISSVDPEKIESIEAFIKYAVTENRLKQGLEYIKEMGLIPCEKTIGDFIRWMFNDIMREEADTMEASGITNKDVASKISFKSRTWYYTQF